jgi:hypothetical protein
MSNSRTYLCSGVAIDIGDKACNARGITAYRRVASDTTTAANTQGTGLTSGIKVSVLNTLTAASLTRGVNQGEGQWSTQHLHNDDATRELLVVPHVLAVAAQAAREQQETRTCD